MRQKQLLLGVAATLVIAIASITQINIVSAEPRGEAGFGGEGGVGGTGGGGGGGGGGGFDQSCGALSAYGDFVYVLEQQNLYQFAAYDLKLVKKIDLSGNDKRNRVHGGRAGGRGGDGAPGENGNGGRGGDGGAGGGAGYLGSAVGKGDDVAAYGEFVYVLQGRTLHKLYADGLKPMKVVKLDFDAVAGK